MDFKGTKVLLLDGYCRQNAVILRELHKLGCIVTTVNASKLDIGYASRYPKKKILEPNIKKDLNYYKIVIKREVESGNYDVVIPVIEETTQYISENLEAFSKFIRASVPTPDAFERAGNKQLTMEICMKNGINCPVTKMDDESIEEFLTKVKFPLALKPRQGRGSVGFKRADTKEELMDLINSKKIIPEEYVIQEFIEDAEVHRVSYTFMDGGKAKTSLMAKSVAPYPLVVGTNSLFIGVNMPDIADQSEKLLKLMGWKGYASVCYIESEHDGIPKVMEINGRISASFKISFECGANIIRQMLEQAYGVNVTEYPKVVPEGMAIKHSQAYFMWWLKSKDRFRKNDKIKHKSDVVFSWSDPLPYITYTLQDVLKYKTEINKRKRS